MKRYLKRFLRDAHSIPVGIKLVIAVIFLRALGWGFIDPFYSFYLDQFGGSYTVIGFLSAIIWVASLLTLIPLMRITDRVKEGVIIQDGEVFYLLAVILFLFAGKYLNLPLLALGLFACGIGHTCVVVGSEAYIRKHSRLTKQSLSFASYITSDYLGWVLGMLGAFFLIPYYNFNNMFFFVVPSILLSLFVLPHIRERGIRSMLRGIKKYFHTSNDFVEIFDDLKQLNLETFFYLFISFFDGMLKMFVLIFIPLFAFSVSIPLPNIALLMAIMYMPFAFSFFLSEFTDRFNKLNTIATGLFIGALCFLLLFFVVDQSWVILLTAMVSFAMAIIRPAYNGALTRLTPRRMLGEITSINGFFERVGRIVGPIIAGLMADSFGIEYTFLLVAVIALFLGGLSLVLKYHFDRPLIPVHE